MSFDSLPLDGSIKKAVREQGYDKPSPIQEKAIPLVLQGHDLMAAAQTGTGKTAGFTLPMLHNLDKGTSAGSNQARALILTPTRELAAQIFDNIKLYSKYLPTKTNVVFGGVKINPAGAPTFWWQHLAACLICTTRTPFALINWKY